MAGGELEYEGELALRLDAGGGVASAERRGLGRGMLEEEEEEGGLHRYKPLTEYEGEWGRDAPHGYGQRVAADGEAIEGVWRCAPWPEPAAACPGLSPGPHPHPRPHPHLRPRSRPRPHSRRHPHPRPHPPPLDPTRYGVPYGVATVTVPAHGTYDGVLVAGQREGFGEMRYASGDVYAGDWERGLPHGQGVLRLKGADEANEADTNGAHAEDGGDGGSGDGGGGGGGGDAARRGGASALLGDDLRRDAVDVHHPASRAGRRTYLGQFYEGARQGVGAELLANGEGFLGYWGAGKRNGVGLCNLPDGSVYEGEIEAGAIHGRGRMVYANGDTYIGAWVRGARHGMGLMTRLLPGTVGGADLYHGDWRDDRPGGHGSASYENGDEFAGEWVDGQRHGEGVSKCASARGPTAVPHQPATACNIAHHNPPQPITAAADSYPTLRFAGTLTALCTKESGVRANGTARARTSLLTARFTRATGIVTSAAATGVRSRSWRRSRRRR